MGRASREKRRRRVQAHSRRDALPREPTASRPADEGLAITAVSLCFLLSGFAALLYQTAWLRQFSIVFGTSELAVATVLAAYMGGLAAGAAAAERLIHRIRRPVLVYGVLELGIAAAALAVPLLLAGASSLFAAALGGQTEPPDSDGWTQPVFYMVTTFLILAIPTGLMGATLPLLTRHVVRTDEQVGPRVALLYTINTAGAVLGTLTAAFLLWPRVGLLATVVVGVIANAAVFLVAVLLARSLSASAALVSADQNAQARLPGLWQGVIRPVADGTRPLRARLAAAFRDQTAWILPLMLLSGAVAFSYEVLWTRLLNHVLGGTVYAFATMLASFLTGIAIGGAIGGRVGADRRRAVPAFAVSQFMIAGLSAGIYLWLSGFVPDAAGLAANAAVAMGVMLPATLFIGATFPLAVRIFADGPKQASQATARVYAWNTAGAISGAIVAGFLIIPWLGFAGSVRLNVAINLLLGTAALLLMSRMRLQLGFAATAVAMLAVFLYQPGKPMALIDTSVIDADRGGRTLYYSVGRSATVFLKEREG